MPRPGSPALVAVIGGLLALEGNTHAAYIIKCIPGMNAEEMAVEAFAEPVAELRHHQPVLELLVLLLVERPRVITACEFECRLLAQPELHTDVWSRCSPIKKIGLGRNVLRAGVVPAPPYGKKDSEYQFFHMRSISVILFFMAQTRPTKPLRKPVSLLLVPVF